MNDLRVLSYLQIPHTLSLPLSLSFCWHINIMFVRRVCDQGQDRREQRKGSAAKFYDELIESRVEDDDDDSDE